MVGPIAVRTRNERRMAVKTSRTRAWSDSSKDKDEEALGPTKWRQGQREQA